MVEFIVKGFGLFDFRLDASDASSAVQYVLLFGESVPYLARTLSDYSSPKYINPKAPFCLCA